MIFKKFDDDGSGAIEKDEAKKIFEEVLKKMHVTKIAVTDEMLDHWFKIADTNGDQKISPEEAEEFVKKHLMMML